MEEIEIEAETSDFIPGHTAIGVSPALTAKTARFLEVPGNWSSGWHPTPVQQYVVPLSGGFKIETGDGQTREFRPGEMILLDDTTGRGHFTTFLGDSWILAVALE